MELNQLTQHADKLIRRVVNKYNSLYSPSGEISQVELDLLLDDLRQLYDTFKNVSYLNSSLVKTPIVQMPQMEPKASKEAYQPAAPKAEDVPESKSVASDNNMPQTAEMETKKVVYTLPAEPEQEETEIDSEPEAADTYSVSSNDNPVEEKIMESAASQLTSVMQSAETINQDSKSENYPAVKPSTIADAYKATEKSISDALTEKSNQVLGARMILQPISDLAAAIGLNDKFSFISELFNNDISAYEEAILRINRAVNFDEGMWILQSYHTKDWELNKETSARFKDFVKRRFI